MAKCPGVGARATVQGSRAGRDYGPLGVRKLRRWVSTRSCRQHLRTRNALVCFYVGTRARSALRPLADHAPSVPQVSPLSSNDVRSVAASGADAGAEVRQGVSCTCCAARAHADCDGRSRPGALRNYTPDLWLALTDAGHWCAHGPASPCSKIQEPLLISGVLYDEMWTPQEDTGYYVMNPSLGQAVPLFPQGQGARAYLVHTKATSRASREPQLCPRFVEESVKTCPRPVVCWSQSCRPSGHV